MTTTSKTKARKAGERSARPKVQITGAGADAIVLLETDHRDVDALFEAYDGLSSAAQKKALAGQICLALKVHTRSRPCSRVRTAMTPR